MLEEGRRDTSLKREVDRWTMRQNLGAGWSNMRLKEIKKRVEENGLDKWTTGIGE